jgi:hypothetical protein
MIRKGFLPLAMAVFIAPMFLAAPAYAQAEKGDAEVLVSGFLFSTLASSGPTLTSGSMNFAIGKFVTDTFEVGVGPSVSITSTSVPESRELTGFDSRLNPIFTTIPASTTISTTFGSNFFARKLFGTAKVQPYVGGNFNVQDFAAAADTSFYGGEAGVKNYFSPKTALDLKGGLGFNAKDPANSGLFTFSVGITYLF